MCCKLDCLWYGLNSEWPKHLTSEHWCCPICGIKYAASMYKPNLGNFSFVCSMPDVETGERVYFPAVWPDAADHK